MGHLIVGTKSDGTHILVRTDDNGYLLTTDTGTPASYGIGQGRKTVTTAGTRVALASSTACREVTIQALRTNTGVIAVGGTGVVAASGTEQGIILERYDSITIEVANLSSIYLDSTVNGEGVTFIYKTTA